MTVMRQYIPNLGIFLKFPTPDVSIQAIFGKMRAPIPTPWKPLEGPSLHLLQTSNGACYYIDGGLTMMLLALLPSELLVVSL